VINPEAIASNADVASKVSLQKIKRKKGVKKISE
jgi:hypothetical protein